jgi:outer membrane receptor protein involved in Fe transport
MLSLTPSGRYDHNSQAGGSANPRVQLTADATPWMKFSASAARSFRAPTIDDLYFVFTGVPPFISPFNGNPNLRPERAWTYDAGVEFHDETKSIRLSYFRANITDLIQVDPITFATSENIGSARRQGMEIEGHQKFSEQWQQSLNYTYLENRGIVAGQTDFVSLAYSPRHTLNHTLTWQPAKAWTIDGITRYLDSRYSGNNQTGTKLGSQVTWDTRIGYRRSRTEFFLGVNDMFNKRYDEQANFPLPGRTYYGGVQWHFE